MKSLFKIHQAISVIALTVFMMALPAIAYANPILDGMKNTTAINIAKALIVVVALIILGGQTIPDLMKGDGGAVIKSALGVAVLVGVAVKLKDIIDLFAGV